MLLPTLATLLFCTLAKAALVSQQIEVPAACPDHWIDATLTGLGKGSEKKPGKSLVFCQTPLGHPPPPWFGLFYEKKIEQ